MVAFLEDMIPTITYYVTRQRVFAKSCEFKWPFLDPIGDALSTGWLAGL